MSNLNLRCITNGFQDVQLVSMAAWSVAKEISPCDHGGPYMVLQEGYDPEDLKVIADEFVLGRSGRWLSLSYFFKMPVAERRAEFVFGTAAEVMQMMEKLPAKAVLLRPDAQEQSAAAAPESDEMAAAFQLGRGQKPGAASETK